MKKIFGTFIIFILTIFTMVGCTNKSNEINILYTTDIHAGITDNIGLSALSGYKNELKNKSKYVELIDAGDIFQGDYIGAVSKGKDIIDIMNEMDYSMMTLGNHEFDYGLDELKSRIDEFKGDTLSCNLKYTGTNTNKLSKVKPYTIKKYGKTKIGYVGVTTPTSVVCASPSTFMEDGKYVYDFSNTTKGEFYTTVQNNIDACKKDGAKYIILLSHLGYGEEYSDVSANELCKNINNIDLILDGHAHSINKLSLEDKDGKAIPYLIAGTKLNRFGHITIKDGKIDYNLIDKVDAKDEKIEKYIDEVIKKSEELGNKVLATSNYTLKITDENGIRLVRTRETAIGNLIADSYRYIAESDIAFVNGGGIRADLNEGDLTFKNIMSIHPFGNTICLVKATGAEILDYLEFATRETKSTYIKDGNAYGESGVFCSVSGLKFKVNTSIDPNIELDEYGSFVKVTGERRVSDVYVLENGSYVKIDPTKTYTVASHNYMLVKGGDGVSIFVDNEMVRKDIMLDYEAVVAYIIDCLKGDLKTKYSKTEGRIVIE